MRENPKDELEQKLAEEEADFEVQQFLSRFTPKFRQRVEMKIAEDLVSRHKPSTDPEAVVYGDV
jgi:hypothetical protein